MNGPVIAQVIWYTIIVLVCLALLAAVFAVAPEIGLLIVGFAVLIGMIYLGNIAYQWAQDGTVSWSEFWGSGVGGT